MPETESLVSDLQADLLVNVVVLRLLKSHKSHEREKSFEDLNSVLTWLIDNERNSVICRWPIWPCKIWPESYLVECDEVPKLFLQPTGINWINSPHSQEFMVWMILYAVIIFLDSYIAQCLMTQTSRNLSTFNFASLMPFFRLITPFLYFYRWFLRQNDVYMQKVPWFFKLKFSAELCRGPGPAGCRTATRRQGHTHTPATTITGDYVAK